jgi:hypothetical protein
LGQSATSKLTLNDSNARTLASIPSGRISLADFYGKSSTGDTGDGYLVMQLGNDIRLGVIAVNFATFTHFAAGFSYPYDIFGAGRLRTGTVSLSLGAYGTFLGSLKNNSIQGILMDTATVFSAGVTSLDVRAGGVDSNTSNNIGYRSNGAARGGNTNNTLKYNMLTYSNSIIAATFAYSGGDVEGASSSTGTESLNKGYSSHGIQYIWSSPVYTHISSLTFATETAAIGGLYMISFSAATDAYRSKTACYFYTSPGGALPNAPTYSFKMSFATEAVTSVPIFYSRPGYVAWQPMLLAGNTGHHNVCATNNMHGSGGEDYGGGMFWSLYNYAWRFNFTTETWTGLLPAAITGGECFGHERYVQPTV